MAAASAASGTRSAPIASLSTSAVRLDVQTPASIGTTKQRDIAKEQQERNDLAVEAEVVNDAPRECAGGTKRDTVDREEKRAVGASFGLWLSESAS